MKKNIRKLLSLVLMVVIGTAITCLATVVKAASTATDTLGVQYQAHVQSIGWQETTSDNQEAGTEGRSLRIEALKIALENLPGYSVQYRVQVQHIGWMDWVSDGNVAGTIGKSYRIEGIDIRIIKTADGSTPTPVPFIGTETTINVSSVSLNKTSDNLTVGGTDTLSATVTPTNATNKNVTWKSSNTNIATVDTNGKVTAIAAGTAIITATKVEDSENASCTVTVTANSTQLSVQSVSAVTATTVKVKFNNILAAADKTGLAYTFNGVVIPASKVVYSGINAILTVSTLVSSTDGKTPVYDVQVNQGTIQLYKQSIVWNKTTPSNLVIASVVAISDVSVAPNATPVLPSIIDVLYKDGSSGKESVTWGTVSTSTVGLKKVSGKIDASTVTATINVNVTAVEYVKNISFNYFSFLGIYTVNVQAESNVSKITINGLELYYNGNGSYQISTLLTKGSTATVNVYDATGKLLEAKKSIVQ